MRCFEINGIHSNNTAAITMKMQLNDPKVKGRVVFDDNR